MNGYELSRNFYAYSFENPRIIKPNHCAVYFFAVDHCNRLGWKSEFGFPTSLVMEATGIKSYNTYVKTISELVDFGFIKMIEKSKNQYSSNIIALSGNDKALDKALDKASIKHLTKQSESTQQSTVQSISSIIKQLNKEQLNNKQVNQLKEIINKYDTDIIINDKEDTLSKKEEYEFLFEQFWDIYDKKTGKEKSLKEWSKLKEDEIKKIFEHVEEYVKATPEKQYRKNPHSYLYNKTFNDEIIKSGKRTIFDIQLEQANRTREFLERNNPFASYDNEN